MTMQRFIRNHRAEIDQSVKAAYNYKPRNDEEREE